MRSIHRLRNNYEFRRIFQRGKSIASPRIVLYWYRDTRVMTYRVGFSVSKKVGNAVIRNRMKRLLKECFMKYDDILNANPHDLVVVCRPGSGNSTFSELLMDVEKLLKRAKFMV